MGEKETPSARADVVAVLIKRFVWSFFTMQTVGTAFFLLYRAEFGTRGLSDAMFGWFMVMQWSLIFAEAMLCSAADRVIAWIKFTLALTAPIIVLQATAIYMHVLTRHISAGLMGVYSFFLVLNLATAVTCIVMLVTTFSAPETWTIYEGRALMLMPRGDVLTLIDAPVSGTKDLVVREAIIRLLPIELTLLYFFVIMYASLPGVHFSGWVVLYHVFMIFTEGMYVRAGEKAAKNYRMFSVACAFVAKTDFIVMLAIAKDTPATIISIIALLFVIVAMHLVVLTIRYVRLPLIERTILSYLLVDVGVRAVWTLEALWTFFYVCLALSDIRTLHVQWNNTLHGLTLLFVPGILFYTGNMRAAFRFVCAAASVVFISDVVSLSALIFHFDRSGSTVLGGEIFVQAVFLIITLVYILAYLVYSRSMTDADVSAHLHIRDTEDMRYATSFPTSDRVTQTLQDRRAKRHEKFVADGRTNELVHTLDELHLLDEDRVVADKKFAARIYFLVNTGCTAALSTETVALIFAFMSILYTSRGSLWDWFFLLHLFNWATCILALMFERYFERGLIIVLASSALILIADIVMLADLDSPAGIVMERVVFVFTDIAFIVVSVMILYPKNVVAVYYYKHMVDITHRLRTDMAAYNANTVSTEQKDA